MLTREQAYKDYLDQYEIKVNNLINQANNGQKNYIRLSLDAPKSIIDKLKDNGYDVKILVDWAPFETIRSYLISWGKEEIKGESSHG